MKNMFTENRLLYKNAPSESGGTEEVQTQAEDVEKSLEEASKKAEQVQKSTQKITQKTEETRSGIQKIMNWKTAARITGAAVFAPYLAAELAYAGYKGTKAIYNNGGKQTAQFVGSRIGAVAQTGLSGVGEIAGSLAMAPLRTINAGMNAGFGIGNVTVGTAKKISSVVPGVLDMATRFPKWLGVPGAEYVNNTFKDAQGRWSKSGGENFSSAGKNISNIGSRLGETFYDAKNVVVNVPSTGVQMASELVKPANNFTKTVEDFENTIVQSRLPRKVLSTDPEKNGKFFSVPDEKAS